MKRFFRNMLIRIIIYGLMFLLCFVTLPYFWNHGSSVALEFLFFIIFCFIIAITFLENALSNF